MSKKRWWGYRLLGLAALGFFVGFVCMEVELWRADWRASLIFHAIMLVVGSLFVGVNLLMAADVADIKGGNEKPELPDGIDSAGDPYGKGRNGR